MNTTKPTLVVRCPKGHALIEVVWEAGTLYADTYEAGSKILQRVDGSPMTVPAARVRDRLDLRQEAADRGIVTVACKCGARHVAMEPLYDAVLAGASGVSITDAPVVG